MNDIKFTKTNGGMGRKAANEDPISGLLMYLKELEAEDLNSNSNVRQFDGILPSDGDTNLYVAKLRCEEDLSDYGLTLWKDVPKAAAAAVQEHNQEVDVVEGEINAELGGGSSTPGEPEVIEESTASPDSKMYALRAIAYHVREFFRMNPEGTLYLGVKFGDTPIEAEDIEAIQNQANGSIRQLGVFSEGFCGKIEGFQTMATALEAEHKPLSIIGTESWFTGEVNSVIDDIVAVLGAGSDPEPSEPSEPAETSAGDYPHTFATLTSNSIGFIRAGQCNVSFLVGCDLDPDVVGKLGGDVEEGQPTHYAYYGCIGTCLGAVSKAAVHESIAWVGQFPLGLGAPGLITGELIKEVSAAKQEQIDNNHYIFVRTHVGNADNFFNDSHTLDEDTSDYAYIENVRTIDKACRGIRANLLPYLNSPLKVDAETGKLDAPMVAFLETTAGKALEDMEKAGELSGYRAEIDPDQNVLATSQVEVIVRNVPMGVMRKVHVKIGFTTALS